MPAPPAVPWLTAAAGNQQVTLNWGAIQARLDFEAGMPAGLVSDASGPATRIASADATTGTTMALQPADLGDSTVAGYEFPISVAAGPMTFRYSLDSESGYDFGRIYVDGVEKYANSGSSGGYQSLNVDVAAGTRTIRVQFSKDGSASVGFDNIRLGSVTYAVAATDYEYRVDGGTPVSVGSGTATSVIVTGLTNAQAYTFEVRAINAEGAGPWSSVVSATPIDLGDLIIDDSFDRANSTTSPGTPDLALGAYTVRSGTWGIISNQLYTSVSAVSQITFPATHDFRIDITLVVSGQATGANGAALMGRWIDANNHWFFGRRATGVVALQRCIAGTYYQYSPDFNVVEGVTRIGLGAFGNKVYAYLNDRLVVQIDDPWAATAAPVAGIRIASSTAARLDDLYGETLLVRPGDLPDGSTSEVLADLIVGVDSGIQPFVYKGRDKRSADEGSVA